MTLLRHPKVRHNGGLIRTFGYFAQERLLREGSAVVQEKKSENESVSYGWEKTS